MQSDSFASQPLETRVVAGFWPTERSRQWRSDNFSLTVVTTLLRSTLPDDFGPDCGISFARFHPNGTTRFEPVGTNLLTATQARQMLEHVLGRSEAEKQRDSGFHAALGRA